MAGCGYVETAMETARRLLLAPRIWRPSTMPFGCYVNRLRPLSQKLRVNSAKKA